jgi:hypothetical protein
MNTASIRAIMETLSWLGFFAAILLSFYFYLRFRNKERMALIEKGIDVSEIFKSRDFTFKFPWLRLGVLAVWIGLGAVIAFLFILNPPQPLDSKDLRGESEFILLISIIIFGGIGIILGHILERSGKKKNG